MAFAQNTDSVSATEKREIRFRDSIASLLNDKPDGTYFQKIRVARHTTPLSGDTTVKAMIDVVINAAVPNAKLVSVDHNYGEMKFGIIYCFLNNQLLSIYLTKSNRTKPNHYDFAGYTRYYFSNGVLLEIIGKETGYTMEYLRSLAEQVRELEPF
jgi:hypothetical protein